MAVADEGIYLRWCPNRKQEQVTGYKVYRTQVSGGPYQQVATLTNPANVGDDCLLGSKRCTINCLTPPCLGAPAADATPCTVGLGGSCKLVDKGIQYSSYVASASTQLGFIYYYVVTAVRGTEESAYSAENTAWPNYLVGGTSPPAYIPRYDQDNLGDFGCDDETSSIEAPVDDRVAVANVSSAQETEREFEARMSSYVVIGNRRSGGGGGGGGGGSGPPPVGRWLFLHSDHLGSPRVVMDDAGNKVSGHHFMPFGEEKPLGSRLTSNATKFTGHERDVESASFDNPDGLDYMMARYYSSSLGRFMSPDPLAGHPQQPQTLNRYIYAGNNPIRFTDPTGLDFYLKCKGNSATCQGGHSGTTTKDKNGKEHFDETVIHSEKDGSLKDQNGNAYTGQVDSTGVHFTDASGKSSTGTWQAGSNATEFAQTSGKLSGFSFRFAEAHTGQDARGTFKFNGAPESAMEALRSAGFTQASTFGHSGAYAAFRSSGDENGDNSAHFLFLNGPLTPPTTGGLHTGEWDYHQHPLRHTGEVIMDILEGNLDEQ